MTRALGFALILAVLARAEEAPPFATGSPIEKSPPAIAPAEAVPKAPPRRMLSPAMSARLLALTPKFTVAENTADKPGLSQANASAPPGVIVLPKFHVEDRRLPEPDERHVLTAKGETAIAMRRYITETDRALNFFTLPLFGVPKEVRAMAMLREDQRLRDRERFRDMADLMRFTSPDAAREVKRAVERSFIRERDFGK